VRSGDSSRPVYKAAACSGCIEQKDAREGWEVGATADSIPTPERGAARIEAE
jgi:hypothetical protein